MRRIPLLIAIVATISFAGSFSTAKRGATLVFPQDHFEHPSFKTEWWYFTGNLKSADGREYGYQFTIFRNAVGEQGPMAPRASAWAARDLLLAHVALTDGVSKTHRSVERFGRGTRASFSRDPFGVKVEEARMVRNQEGSYTLSFDADGLGLSLDVSAVKPRVLQGDHGYSRKGKDPSNASYYVSFTRMKTEGSISIEGRSLKVTGTSWMDHEWSTSALDDGQVGWDWFALHLDDGTDLMIYRLRQADGGAGPFSSGTVVDARGRATALHPSEFSLEPTEVWQSPRSKGRYPVAWRVRIPAQGIDVRVRARVDDQEMKTSIRYWEGAVGVIGSHGGSGYLEMTGYADALGQYLGR